MAGVGDALLHLRAGDRIAVGLCARVDHDARPVKPVEGQLVDRRCRRAGDARVVVPRRVDVGRRVRADRQPFARRALLVTEQAAIDAEQLLELRRALRMIGVLDVDAHERRQVARRGLDDEREVDESAHTGTAQTAMILLRMSPGLTSGSGLCSHAPIAADSSTTCLQRS